MVFVGLDIGGTKTAVSLGGGDGTIRKKKSFPTHGKPEEVLERCALIIEEYQKDEVVQAIGISCGGPLDSEKGIIQSPPNLPLWDDIEIVAYFEERFGIPTFLENDANACALAEWYWGAGIGSSSMVFLTFGTGLGAGLILDSRLYRGVNGLAGEVGHIRIADDGPMCYYKRGSWESYCSGCGISGLYKIATQEERSAKEICALADANDPAAKKVLEKSAAKLGLGIAILIDVLNVERIIIGSIFERSEHLFRSIMEEVIKREALQASRESCAILPSGLGDELGDLAALGVARDGYQRSTHNA
ncbi:MAG: ROK family protein [Spirochaetales bacterium]|nr:ROK family protein [Spirochaetales bacterium]